MTNTKTFQDVESNTERTGRIEKSFFIGEQNWLAVTSQGINWLVPQGWPNNATPICEESEPEVFAGIMGQGVVPPPVEAL